MQAQFALASGSVGLTTKALLILALRYETYKDLQLILRNFRIADQHGRFCCAPSHEQSADLFSGEDMDRFCDLLAS